MLADDLKLSSDDEDTPGVGSALQLLNSDHDKSKCSCHRSYRYSPLMCVCVDFYLCINKQLQAFLTICSCKASMLFHHPKFDTSVSVCF